MRIDAFMQVQQMYGAKKPSGVQKTSKPSFMDAVQISSTGKDFQLAKQAVMNAPDIREELVEPIKTSVQNGTYDVSDADFADKLLEKYSQSLF